MTGWTLRLKLCSESLADQGGKCKSGFSGTVSPSTHHLLSQICSKMSKIWSVRVEGHLPAGHSASPSLPPHLCTWQRPGVSPALPRMQAISQQDQTMFAKDIRKKCQEHMYEWMQSSVLPASLLPWPRATPSWCFFLLQEAERNLKFPQRVGPQMQEEHFPHWYFKTISQSPNRQPHAITDQKAKSASLDCVCVCIKTQIITFEGKSDSQQNSLRWHCGFWPCLRREEDRLISDKSYLFDHQIWGENISLRQAQNVIYKDRLCSLNTNKCGINRKAGTSIVFTFCIEYFGCYDVTSWNIKKGRFRQDNNTKMLTRFFLLLFIWFSFLLKE